jgi:hypothetical protein
MTSLKSYEHGWITNVMMYRQWQISFMKGWGLFWLTKRLQAFKQNNLHFGNVDYWYFYVITKALCRTFFFFKILNVGWSGIRIPTGATDFSFYQKKKTRSDPLWPAPKLLFNVHRRSFPGLKQQVREVEIGYGYQLDVHFLWKFFIDHSTCFGSFDPSSGVCCWCYSEILHPYGYAFCQKGAKNSE